MRRKAVQRLALVGIAASILGSCQLAGPRAIDMGRGRYNNIIQSTSMEQTMANIVRVYHHEPPMFMDVTEVDATLSIGGSITGASSGIGARRGTSGGTLSGQVGTAGGTLQYSETPTIRYQPLLGQALVAQLVTPVSVDALGLLYDSSWSPAPLIDLSSNYMTPDPTELYSAIDTISELDDRLAVEIAAAQSMMHAAKAEQKPSSDEKKDAPHATNNDALVFYLLPFHKAFAADENRRIFQLWIRMLRIYNGSQPPFVAPAGCAKIGISLDQSVLDDWDTHIARHVQGSDAEKMGLLAEARNCVPNFVELRIVPTPLSDTDAVAKSPGKHRPATPMGGTSIATHAPLMRTYSALGILKNATDRGTGSPRIGFVTPEIYHEIRENHWNADPGASFYTLLPKELDSVDCSPDMKAQGGCENPTAQLPPDWQTLDVHIVNWLNNYGSPAATNSYPDGLVVLEQPGADMLGKEYMYLNARLGTLRRYVLVIVTDEAPSERAYVSYSYGGKWYWIAGDDVVSQRNFQLLSLFMSMMAIPPSTQPLSPVINVGG